MLARFLKTNWKIILGVATSACCLYWFIGMCDFLKMWEALGRTNYWFVLLTLVSIFTCYFARAVRWTFLLKPVKRVQLGPSFSATIIGFTASNILPMRAGEFVRAYVLGKNENVKATSVFATIVIERLCDGFCVLAILVFALLIVPIAPLTDIANLSEPMQKIVTIITREKLCWFGYSTLGLYLGIIAVLTMLRLAPEMTERLITKLLFFAPSKIVHKVTDTFRSFSDGISSLNTVWQAANVALWSLVTWGAIAVGPWLLSLAFGLRMPISMGLFVTAVLAFGVMLPSSPGFIGIFQLSTAAAMVMLGVSEHIAATYALMLWALSIIPVTILGFIFCWMGKTSFAQIIRATKQEKLASEGEP